MADRKAISKKVRFEVFKRDKFTCQYCGRQAPDVVLQVDHIDPVASGGSGDVLNLITSCFDCNSGKGKRPLSDDSAVAKQRNQLSALQERKEQLEMMMEWQRSLTALDRDTVEAAASYFSELVEVYSLSDSGKKDLGKLIRKHGLEAVLSAMRIAVEQYVTEGDDGRPTRDSVGHAFSKIGGICRVTAAEKDNPQLKDVFYIRGVVRNRMYCVDWRAKQLLESAFSWGGDRDVLYDIAANARNWTSWQDEMLEYIGDLRKNYPEGDDGADQDS